MKPQALYIGLSVSSNKRKHPRVQARGVFTHFRAGDELALGMRVENISLGGLFVRSDKPFPRATPLVLELVPPGSLTPLKLVGRVVAAVWPADAQRRGLTPGMGIRFEPMTAEVLQRLKELVGSMGAPVEPIAAIPPTQVDLNRRSVFDFGFGSLENLPEASVEPPAARPLPTAAAPPSLPPADNAAASPAASSNVVVAEGARLMLQIRGLLMELSEAKAELDRERDENAQLRARLALQERRIAELAAKR